nr:hypothetical protein BaRGS_006326 [Batillaria attramentaria]
MYWRQSKNTVCMVLLIVIQAIAILWILYAPETSDALVEAPATQKAFDKVMQKAKPEPEGLLLCAHLRMGNNGNISFRDSERRHTYQHGDTVLRFLLQYDHEIKRKVLTGTAVGEPKMKENGTGHQSFALAMLRNRRDLINPSNSFHGDDRNVTSSGAFPAVPTVRFFVASDSEDFVNKAEKLFGERFVRTEGKVVNSVAFSQDFQMLVTGSDDQRVRVFNTRNAEFICKLKGHEGNRVMGFHGFRVLGQKRETVEPKDRTMSPCVSGASRLGTGSCFLTRRHLSASSSDDDSVKVWDVVNGQCVRTLEGQTDQAQHCSFTPGGALVASGAAMVTLAIT